MYISENNTLHHVDSSLDIIEHYGIRGMKWGKKKAISDKTKRRLKIAGGIALAAGGAYLSYKLGKKANGALNNIKYDKKSVIANQKAAKMWYDNAHNDSPFNGSRSRRGAMERVARNLDEAKAIESKYNKRGKRILYNNIEKIPTVNGPRFK